MKIQVIQYKEDVRPGGEEYRRIHGIVPDHEGAMVEINKFSLGNINTTNWQYPGIVDKCWPPNPWDENPNPWKTIHNWHNFIPKEELNFRIVYVDETTRKIEVKVAGFKPDEISVSVEGNLLMVSAVRKTVDNFIKTVSNSHEIMRHEKVESADLEYGILTIVLKGKKEKSTKIPVKEK